jgi:hypothetical protein
LRSQSLSTPSKLSRVWNPVGYEPIHARCYINKKELEEDEEGEKEEGEKEEEREEEEGVAPGEPALKSTTKWPTAQTTTSSSAPSPSSTAL